MIHFLAIGTILFFILRKVKLKNTLIEKLWGAIAHKWAKTYDVNDKLVLAIIEQESGGNPLATGSTNDVGLMQITQPALTDYNSFFGTDTTLTELLMNPDQNIEVGTWYISWLLEQFNSNEFLAVSAYNQGIGNVKKDSFNSDYANSVLARKEKY